MLGTVNEIVGQGHDLDHIFVTMIVEQTTERCDENVIAGIVDYISSGGHWFKTY